MGPRLPITTTSRVFLAGAALLLLGACATAPTEPETSGPGQQVSSAQVLAICEKLSKSKDTRLAIGLCEKAHLDEPDNPVPLLLLGDMLQQKGALAQAGRAYGMAIDLDPVNVEAHYGLGKVFLARNQFDLAIEQFEVARELNTRDHRLYNALGVVLDNLGDHVAAQAHYKIGLELAPDNHALLKNLTLSRRLDDTVTTPAIGPQHKVVPDPVSAPGAAPQTLPLSPVAPVPGRLGHEPLAQVHGQSSITAPANAGVTNSVVPESTSVAVPVHSTSIRTVSAPAHHSVRTIAKPAPVPDSPAATAAAAVESGVRPVESQVAAMPVQPKVRLIPLPPRAKPLMPADASPQMYARAETADPQLPVAQTAKVNSTATVSDNQIQTNQETMARSPRAATEPVVQSSAAKPRPLSLEAERGPKILGSGFSVVAVEPEALEALKAPEAPEITLEEPEVLAIAELPLGRSEFAVSEVSVSGIEVLAAEALPTSAPFSNATSAAAIGTEVTKQDAFASEVKPAGPTSAGQPSTALITESVALDSMASNSGQDHFNNGMNSRLKHADLEPVLEPVGLVPATRVPSLGVAQEVSPAPLTLVSARQFQTASLQADDGVIPSHDARYAVHLPEFEGPDAGSLAEASPSPVKQSTRLHRRFGREHEENHETRQVEGELWDLVDVVNPMQHIPVISTLYRDVTEDEIKPAARIAGGTLFGGVLGFASSLVESMIEEASGQDIGETALAAMSNSGSDDSAETQVAERERRMEWRGDYVRGR